MSIFPGAIILVVSVLRAIAVLVERLLPLDAFLLFLVARFSAALIINLSLSFLSFFNMTPMICIFGDWCRSIFNLVVEAWFNPSLMFIKIEMAIIGCRPRFTEN